MTPPHHILSTYSDGCSHNPQTQWHLLLLFLFVTAWAGISASHVEQYVHVVAPSEEYEHKLGTCQTGVKQLK